MALIVNQNSYANVDDADLYFEDRLFSDAWISSDDEVKTQALITATRFLDTLCTWSLDKADENQPLEFPRGDDTEVPEKVIISLYEITLEMIIQGLSVITDEAESIKGLKAGPVQLSFFEAISDPYTIINNITKAYLSAYGICYFGTPSIQQPNLIR
jgi:hypothetical protein